MSGAVVFLVLTIVAVAWLVVLVLHNRWWG